MTEQFVSSEVDVEIASAETCTSLDSHYDVILMPAILEHLYEPVEVLKRCKSELLFVDVPNEGSLAMRLGNLYMRPRSINLSPSFAPYHVIGFTEKSLTKALDIAGYDVVEMLIPKYDNQLPAGSVKRKLERAAMGIVQQVGYRLKMGDGLMAWAKRKSSHS